MLTCGDKKNCLNLVIFRYDSYQKYNYLFASITTEVRQKVRRHIIKANFIHTRFASKPKFKIIIKESKGKYENKKKLYITIGHYE